MERCDDTMRDVNEIERFWICYKNWAKVVENQILLCRNCVYWLQLRDKVVARRQVLKKQN